MRSGRWHALTTLRPSRRPVRLRLELLEDRLPPGDLGMIGALLLDMPLPSEEPTAETAYRRETRTPLSSAVPRTDRDRFEVPALVDLAGSFGAFALPFANATAPMPNPTGARGPADQTDTLLASLAGLDGPGIDTVGPNVPTHNRVACPSGRGVVQSETAVAVSGNAVVVGYNDFRAFYCPQLGYQWIGWSYSLDGGETFTDGGSLPGTTNLRGDPWLATGPDGTIFLASLWTDALNRLAVLRGTVTESGIDWSAPVLTPLGFGPADKEALTVDPYTGFIYLTYARLGSGLWSSRSLDGGLSFEAPVPIRLGAGTQAPVPVVGPNSEVYVTYNFGYPASTGVGFAVSYDFGETFYDFGQVGTTGFFSIPGTDRAPAFPQIAVDLSGGPYWGSLYLVWHTNHLRGNGDVAMITSRDGGFTWSAPLIVNDDLTTGHQWLPTVSVDAYGFVNVFFNDRRENPGTAITNLYFAQSVDGGKSFLPNVRITDTASVWTTSPDGAPAHGDYINSVSTFDPKTYLTHSLVAYADSRNGDPDTYFTRVIHDFA